MARTVGVVAALAVVGAVKMSSYDQGAAFTKCISITDYESKTLDDDITLIDRVGDCCPTGSVPGTKWFPNYKGAQVVCGFKTDGTVALTTGSSGGTYTCTYNSCYVDKQNLPCADGTKQLLNGCCAATDGGNTGFPAQCRNYYKTFDNAYGDACKYCTTWATDYSSGTRGGTNDNADDQANGKLVPANIDTYTPCGGGITGIDVTTTASSESTSGSIAIAVPGWLLSVAALFAVRL